MLVVYLTYIASAHCLAAGLEKLIDPARVTKLTDDVVKPLLEQTGLPIFPKQKKTKQFSEDMSAKPSSSSDSKSNGSEKASGGSSSSSDQFSFPGLGPLSLNAGSDGASSQGSSQNGVDYRYEPNYSYSPYQPIYQGPYNEIPRYDQSGYGSNGYSDYYNYPTSYGGYGADSSAQYNSYPYSQYSSDPYSQYSSDPYSQYSSDPYSQYSEDPYFEYGNSPTYQFNNDGYPVRDMYDYNQSPYYEGPQYLSNYNPYFG